jgi:hypothetical protein
MKRVLGIGLAGAVASVAIARLARKHAPMSVAEQVDLGLRGRENGWWVRLVLDSFRYLETDYGYSLAEVQMHFKGNFIRYRGPVFEFVTEYDPHATRSVGAELWLVADLDRDGPSEPVAYPRVIDVNRLLRARKPEFPLLETRPPHLDRDIVSKAVAMWAYGLREAAADVLAGAWPNDVAIQTSGDINEP